VARFARQQDELGYRFFLSEVIRQQALGKSWAIDYLDFRDYRPQEERSGEEIAAEVIRNAGLVVR
jgi:hypothetical protein